MVQLYLLGGENVIRRSAKEINECAFEKAKLPLNILVFPWARASFDLRYSKRKILCDYFISLGAAKVDFVEYSEAPDDIADKMAAANLVYLTGGLPSVLIERLQKTGVDRMLKDFGGVIVGRSAGALALCKRCVTTLRRTAKPRLVEGLGLVDLTLKVHYTQEDDAALMKFSMREKIYAVPERSALVWENGCFAKIGDAYLFVDGEKQLLG